MVGISGHHLYDIYIYKKHVKDNTRYCSWIYKILKHTVRIHNTASCLWGGGWESMGLGIDNMGTSA